MMKRMVTQTISQRKKHNSELTMKERDILEARQNKKAQQDAAQDMLLDAIRKSGGKPRKKKKKSNG